MLLEFAHEGIGRFNIIICILSAENCLNMVKGSPAVPIVIVYILDLRAKLG